MVRRKLRLRDEGFAQGHRVKGQSWGLVKRGSSGDWLQSPDTPWHPYEAAGLCFRPDSPREGRWPHYGLLSGLVIAPVTPPFPVTPVTASASRTPQHTVVALFVLSLARGWGAAQGSCTRLVPMATDVTTLPGSAPPLPPRRWELAVVLKGLSRQPPPGGGSVLPGHFLSPACSGSPGPASHLLFPSLCEPVS